MRNNYSIRNFRVFGNDGIQIYLRPITILTGTNSSGKSSIVKSLVLLSDFLANIHNDKLNNQPIRLHKYKLDFSRKPNNLLGSFRKIRHRSAAQEQPITFSYDVFCPTLQQQVRVTLDFNDRNDTSSNDCYLTGMSIENQKGEIIVSTRKPDLMQTVPNGQQIIEEVMTQDITDSLAYISSSIINVKRLYPLELDDEFTQNLRAYLRARSNPQRADYEPDTFMNYWVKQFNIGEKICVETDAEQLGATVRLLMPGEKRGAVLADFGYGITQMFAIMVRIEQAILENKPSTIAIEEPEIHLHPRFQSMMAEMFVDAYKKYGIQFILETHSEYLVRKMQTLVAQEIVAPHDVALVYVYDANPEKRPLYTPQIKQIEIAKDGRLTDTMGTGFLDEANNLSIDLLRAMREE